MKMYALFDTVRNKYFRTVFTGRSDFTVKPYELIADKKRVQERIKRYNNKINWERFGYHGPAPKLQLKEFDVTL